jgi:predicted enzyme related to lactoylglutathione lyase
MAKNRICWWEINAQDAKPLVDFYTGVFGWQTSFDSNLNVWRLHTGDGTDGGIGGSIFTGKGALPNHRCLYVEVDDVDEVTERVKAHGQPILQGPFNLAGVGRLAFFQDPEGYFIGLIHPGGTTAGEA